MMNFPVFWQKYNTFFGAFFYHNPSVHSFLLCDLDIVFRHKMAIFDHYLFVHSIFLCGLDLVCQHKMANSYHNPFVHSFFLCGLDLVSQHKIAILTITHLCTASFWHQSCLTLFHTFQ